MSTVRFDLSFVTVREPFYSQPGREYVSDIVFSDLATDRHNSVKHQRATCCRVANIFEIDFIVAR